jgi:hypothetical protein
MTTILAATTTTRQGSASATIGIVPFLSPPQSDNLTGGGREPPIDLHDLAFDCTDMQNMGFLVRKRKQPEKNCTFGHDIALMDS